MENDPIKTLQRLCITRILVHFWNQADIKNFIESKLTIIFNENMKEWEKVEEKIVEKIRKLSLPKAIENQFADFFRPIGLELIAWIEFHFMHLKLTPQIPGNIYWTSNGSIDLLKTAKILAEDPTLDEQDRYKVACGFCLKKSIEELWKNMNGYEPEEYDYELTRLWSYHYKGDKSKLRVTKMLKIPGHKGIQVRANEKSFRLAVQTANITAAKDFYQILGERERQRTLQAIGTLLPLWKTRRDFKWEKGSFLLKYCFDFFAFVFKDLTEDQRNICKEYNEYSPPYKRDFMRSNFQQRYLTRLLDWPYQELLLEEASSLWSLVPPSDFENYTVLLMETLKKIIHGHKDYDYIQLFKNFWECWPSSRGKKRTVDECCKGWVTTDIYKFAQANSISLIFKDWDLVEFCSDEQYGLRQNWDNDDAGLLAYYILACLCHEDTMRQYVKHYKDRVSKIYNLKFPRDGNIPALDRNIAIWYDFFECLEEFMDHEETEKGLEKMYNCPEEKGYITYPKGYITYPYTLIFSNGQEPISLRAVE